MTAADNGYSMVDRVDQSSTADVAPQPGTAGTLSPGKVGEADTLGHHQSDLTHRDVDERNVHPGSFDLEDDLEKPEDAQYGAPREEGHFVEHAPYPKLIDVNRETMELIADPDAPWGRGEDESPFTKTEYDQRYTQPSTDGKYAWEVCPPNDGAVRRTRQGYNSLGAFTRDYGNKLDRIGPPSGNYLGVVDETTPASFEARSLPVNSLEKKYFKYQLAEAWPPGTESWTLEVARVARAFGRQGGASQMLVRNELGEVQSVTELVLRGILE